MPLQPEEVLRKISEATDEARTTIRELHEARTAALDVIKANRKRIAELIEAEVHSEVDKLATEAGSRMNEAIGLVIRRLEGDWRDKLGLP